MLQDGEDHLRAAAVWAIGQTGKHSSALADAVAQADVLRHILDALKSDSSSDDLREKSKRCLKGTSLSCH